MLGYGLTRPLRVDDLPVAAPTDGPDEPRLYCPECLFSWSGSRELWLDMVGHTDREFLCTMAVHAGGAKPAMQLTSKTDLERRIQEAQEARDAEDFGPVLRDPAVLQAFLVTASQQVLDAMSSLVTDPDTQEGATGFFADGGAPQTAYRRLRYALRLLKT